MELLVTLLEVAGVIVLVVIVSVIVFQLTRRSRSSGRRSSGPSQESVTDPGRANRAARYGAQAPAATDVTESDSRDPNDSQT